MIADVIRKGSYYQTLNESGKKIKDVHESSVGELQGFTERFVVFRKGNYFATYDETFRKIKESHESSVGIFKGAAGQYMTFVKGNYAVTFDVMLKKLVKDTFKQNEPAKLLVFNFAAFTYLLSYEIIN